ncbi:MAG: secondary thiamine-phosphate synthase enzyme YjbQ [Pseudomonadota bacterium]
MPFTVRKIRVGTSAETDVIDLTPHVVRFLDEIGISNGSLTLFIPGSTAALTTIEYERGAIHDLIKAVERMAPEDLLYEHNERWGDGNGYSHVRSALIGPSLHIPIVDGKLTLGTWQQVVLLDFDNRPRERQIIAQFHGE